MSDKPGAKPPPTDPRADPLADIKGDAQAAASKLQTGAAQAADTVRGTVAGAAEEAVSTGEEIAGAARERVEGLADQGKQAVAEQASGFAGAIRHAAEDLESSSPEIARHVRTAADSVEGISAALRDRSAGQLMQDVTDFARRQPAAFFGVAALAGFALARFAKSSSDGVPGSAGRHAGPVSVSPNAAPGWVPTHGDDVPRPATMAAASLGGAVAHRPGDAMPGSMPAAPPHHPATLAPVAPSGSSPGAASPQPSDRSGTPL
jgi:hypothetical protein